MEITQTSFAKFLRTITLFPKTSLLKQRQEFIKTLFSWRIIFWIYCAHFMHKSIHAHLICIHKAKASWDGKSFIFLHTSFEKLHERRCLKVERLCGKIFNKILIMMLQVDKSCMKWNENVVLQAAKLKRNLTRIILKRKLYRAHYGGEMGFLLKPFRKSFPSL